MPANGNGKAKELLIKMIQEEQHQINHDVNEIIKLIHEVRQAVKELGDITDIYDSEVISWPPYQDIKNKLDILENINHHINFRKNLISDYTRQLYLLNSFYTSECMN